jgi:peptide/nickel transport system permease protein
VVRRRIIARLFQSLIVVMIVTTISFFIVRTAPGDPFSYDGRGISLAARDSLRQQYGFNDPLSTQYAKYINNVAHGRLGWSFSKRSSVSAALADALPRTLLLAGVALLASFLIGIVIGVAQAVRRGRWFDRASSAVLLFFYSLPDFWAAFMIMVIVSYWWGVLPSAGLIDVAMHDTMGPWDAFVDRVKHLILPAGSLVVLTIAAVARYQRNAMLEILPSDFVRTARSKGLRERDVVWRHAFRAAATPMVTLFGLMLPGFLGGAIFIEKVYSFPGMGLLAADAIGARDYDLVTATVIVGSVLVVIGTLIADLLQMAIDPRVRD